MENTQDAEAKDLELAIQLQSMEYLEAQKAKALEEQEKLKQQNASSIPRTTAEIENEAEKAETEVTKKHFKEKDDELRSKEVKQTLKKKKEEGKAIKEKKKHVK